MRRFFLEKSDLKNGTVILTDEQEIHHLKDVMRLKKGDCICLFNGQGKEAVGTIVEVKRREVQIHIDSVKVLHKQKNKTIILACAIPKKAKFETIIEKCTELGVDEIMPIITQRTEVILDADRAHRKLKRYETVAVNAAKQSARVTIPKIHNVRKFLEVSEELDKDSTAFIPCLIGRRRKLPQAFSNRKVKDKIIFFIGPEGDFTPEEVNRAIKFGCIPISLGELVLKVDTAAITVVAFTNLFLNCQ